MEKGDPGFKRHEPPQPSNRVGSEAISSLFFPWKAEQGVEFNALLDVAPMLLLQPVIEYCANAAGGMQRAVVFGFRTKV